MSSYTTISNLEIAIETSSSITVNQYYSNELWTNAYDFLYTFENTEVASYSNDVIVGNSFGGTKVTAIHKVTGRVIKFYVIVGFSSTITETPFPTTIIEGLEEPYNVWPAGSSSVYYHYTTADRTQALVGIYTEAIAIVVGGQIADYSAASEMLIHYLDNTGSKYTVDFKAMISECSYAGERRREQINQLMQAAEASAIYSTKSLKTITAYGNELEEFSNWGLSVGKYYTAISCTYRKTSETTYTMDVTYELHDCYNWDNSNLGTLTGILPAQMWELHHGGYARNYEVYGINTFTVTWTTGQRIGEGAAINNEL
jgi:hypothetical protein